MLVKFQVVTCEIFILSKFAAFLGLVSCWLLPMKKFHFIKTADFYSSKVAGIGRVS